LSAEELKKKIRGETSKSPFIYAQSWVSGTSPGATAYYTVHVSNPDPVAYFPFYATIFFGLGNFYDQPSLDRTRHTMARVFLRPDLPLCGSQHRLHL
jgi:hypothetical protein